MDGWMDECAAFARNHPPLERELDTDRGWGMGVKLDSEIQLTPIVTFE